MTTAVRSPLVRLAVVMTVAALLAAGCAQRFSAPAQAPMDYEAAAPAPGLEAMDEAARSAPAAGPAESPAAAPEESEVDPDAVRAKQMIIWTADYDVRVDQAVAAAEQFRVLVERNRGFIAQQKKVISDTGHTRVTVEARVPSAKFMDTLGGLEGLGQAEGGYTSNNVTEEWVDLEARLRVRQMRKEQLETLLRRAQSLEDIDKFQQRIMTVQEEIERLQGRRRYLQDQAAMSTLVARFYEKGLAPVERPGPFSAERTLQRAWYALAGILQALLVLLIWVALPGAVIWVPVLVVVLILRRRRPAPPPAPPPSAE